MDTPVPIPNTEVKHPSGDNSYACHSEDSELPGLSKTQSIDWVFCYSKVIGVLYYYMPIVVKGIDQGLT